MDMLLSYANFAWFRLALAKETDPAKRQELELKLAKVQAEFEAAQIHDYAKPR